MQPKIPKVQLATLFLCLLSSVPLFELSCCFDVLIKQEHTLVANFEEDWSFRVENINNIIFSSNLAAINTIQDFFENSKHLSLL